MKKITKKQQEICQDILDKIGYPAEMDVNMDLVNPFVDFTIDDASYFISRHHAEYVSACGGIDRTNGETIFTESGAIWVNPKGELVFVPAVGKIIYV